MSLDKSELLEKLNLISSRYNDVDNVKSKMAFFIPHDIYERQVELPDFPETEGGEANAVKFMYSVDHTDDSGSDFMRVYEETYKVPYPPKEPEKEKYKEPEKPFSISMLLFVSIAATLVGIALFLFNLQDILSFNFHMEDFITLSLPVIAVVVACVTFIAYFYKRISYKRKKKAALLEFKQNQKAIRDNYNEKVAQYESDMAAYRQKEQEFINEYWVWRAIYLEHLAEEERVSAQLEIDRQAGIEEIERTELIPAQEALNEVNDLVSEEYLHVIDKLIELIQNGRADDLKEAINLYEEIRYKERQLQLEREMEEQRRYEEEMRREEEQRRYEEEMRMHERQERARQEEEMYRRRTEERRQREEARERELQEYTRQAEARREESRRQHEANIAMYRERNATQRQCQSCANMSRCRVAFQRPNCASFVPK